jgi:hypothetical protein
MEISSRPGRQLIVDNIMERVLVKTMSRSMLLGLMAILVGPSEAASVSGLVLDQAGVPLPDARVTISLQYGVDQGFAVSNTDASGKFVFALEDIAATYSVGVEAAGFMPWRRFGFHFGAIDTHLPDIVLAVPGGCETLHGPSSSRTHRILVKIKALFVRTDRSKAILCQ